MQSRLRVPRLNFRASRFSIIYLRITRTSDGVYLSSVAFARILSRYGCSDLLGSFNLMSYLPGGRGVRLMNTLPQGLMSHTCPRHTRLSSFRSEYPSNGLSFHEPAHTDRIHGTESIFCLFAPLTWGVFLF